MPRPRLGSLFSGVGGLDLAVADALNAETVFVADVCKFNKDGSVGHHEPHRSPCSVLAHRFPGVPNLGDVSLIDWSPWRGLIEILCAGFPCQDVSVAGGRAGLRDGTRTGLWSQVVRAITELSPQLVVLENVPGLLSGGTDSDVPNDTCVCGWPYRRGGLHRNLREQEQDLLSQRDRGHDVEGFADLGPAEGEVRGEREADPGCDVALGCGSRLGGLRGRGDSRAGGDSATPRPQGGASAACVEGGGDQGESSGSLDEAERRPASAEVDRGSERPLRDPQAADARVEREGTFDVFAGGEVTHCQACGRSLGDGSVRPAERSWFGAVQRDLAQIGFDADWTVVPASGVGAAHKRERWFCAAYPAGQPWSFEHGDGGLAADSDREQLQGIGLLQGLGGDLSHAVICESCAASDATDLGHERVGSARARWAGPADDGGESLTLLPTPAVNDMRHDGTTLTDATVRQPDRWGDYGPAIRRWEHVLGRPAPEPTKPNAKGSPKLSDEFDEWLMGYPEGWITDVPGVTWNETLKACGNGVMPQQGAAAIRWLVAMGGVA